MGPYIREGSSDGTSENEYRPVNVEDDNRHSQGVKGFDIVKVETYERIRDLGIKRRYPPGTCVSELYRS